tara:strand:- start:972 stop:1343 length:372 start_codon:yes stop_codon:yes gene_type:complete
LGDVGAGEFKAPSLAEGEFRYREESTFLARLKIPADGLWERKYEPAVLCVSVGFHEAYLVPSLSWPDPVDWTETPLVYGDLYAGQPRLSIDGIDFGEPIWGGDASPVTISGVAADEVNGRVEI